MRQKKREALSEQELLLRLRARHIQVSGNGIQHAFMTKVKNAAGHGASRTIDAYAMDLWRSRGLSITAFECKSSRSDWLRELRSPDKAEEFCERADYFYIVAGATDIVQAGELPETWGLMVPHGRVLRVEVEAPRLRPKTDDLPPAFDRSFLAALLRAACAVGTAPAEVKAAYERGREAEREQMAVTDTRYQTRFEELTGRVRDFEQASGITIAPGWPPRPKDVGAAVRLVLDGEHDTSLIEGRLQSLRNQAEAVVRTIDKALPETA